MGPVRFRPISPDALAEELADLLVSRLDDDPGGYLRVGVDGPPPARPDRRRFRNHVVPFRTPIRL